MSWVLKGLSCFGTPRRANAPPKLDGGEWNVAEGEVETDEFCKCPRSGTLKMSCACVMTVVSV